jgi:hypothetical protein
MAGLVVLFPADADFTWRVNRVFGYLEIAFRRISDMHRDPVLS